MTTVRDMVAGDLARVGALSGALGYPVETSALAERFARLRGQRGLFVGVVDGRVAGWIDVHERVLLESPAHAELGALVVDASVRRAGVGRALVDRAIAWTRERRLPTLRVRSNVVRPEAHAFYPALGFALMKTQHTYELAVPR